MSDNKSPQSSSSDSVRPNLSGLPFEQVIEGLLKTPAKRSRKGAMPSAKKAAEKAIATDQQECDEIAEVASEGGLAAPARKKASKKRAATKTSEKKKSAN